MKILFIIPARKGSKRLVGKNKKNFNGKPLICHSIDFAKLVSSFEDTICVTTDDKEILEIAAGRQVDLIINRPSYLATDSATSYDVVMHACSEALNANREFDAVVLLQPTTPFRSKKNFEEIKNNFLSISGGAYISICYKSRDKKNLVYHEPDTMKKAQNGIEGYLNGSIYFFDFNSIAYAGGLNVSNTYYYPMSEKFSIDIDNIDDWNYAESLK